jgi:hypothetical protein
MGHVTERTNKDTIPNNSDAQNPIFHLAMVVTISHRQIKVHKVINNLNENILKLSDSDVDRAFDLLVVIIALIYSMAGSHPELFWQASPELSLEIIALRMTVPPVVSLTLLWLASHLISNKNGKVLLKSVAWMTAFSIGGMLLSIFTEGLKFFKLSKSIETILIFSMIFISPLIIYAVIFPKYKEKYPDISFFRRKVWPIVSYVLYLLVLLTLIVITSSMYAAW